MQNLLGNQSITWKIKAEIVSLVYSLHYSLYIKKYKQYHFSHYLKKKEQQVNKTIK